MGKIEKDFYKILRFNIKDKNGQINPMLVLSEIVDGKWVNTDCENGYEGEFVSLEKYSYKTKEQKTINGFKLILRDNEDGFVHFNSAWNNASQMFINYLLGRDGPIEKIKISFSYGEFNGKMRAALWCNINGEQSNRIISKEEIEEKKLIYPIIDPETGDIEKYSYKKLQDFFESKYDDFNLNVKLKNTSKEITNIDKELSKPISELDNKEEIKEEIKKESELHIDEEFINETFSVGDVLRNKAKQNDSEDDDLPF